MKRIYEVPELEIVKFSSEDVITTSLVDAGEAGNGNDDVTEWK